MGCVLFCHALVLSRTNLCADPSCSPLSPRPFSSTRACTHVALPTTTESTTAAAVTFHMFRRKFACFAIGNAGFHNPNLYDALRPAVGPLVVLLSDEEEKTRANAAGALGNLVRNSGQLCSEIVKVSATWCGCKPAHWARHATVVTQAATNVLMQ